MQHNDPKLRRYYRQIRSWLPCGGKVSKEIMAKVCKNVQHYLNDNPDADLQKLQEHFGEPRAIACSYVEHMDTEELLAALHKRRKIVAIVACAAAVALLIWGAYVAYATWNLANGSPYYYEVETSEYGIAPTIPRK